MVFDVFLPAPVFIYQFLLGETVPLAAHIRKAQIAAAVDIFFQRYGGAGAVLVEDVAEEGIIDGCFALNNRIVVI